MLWFQLWFELECSFSILIDTPVIRLMEPWIYMLG